MAKTRCLKSIEQWRCPAPILMEPTVNGTTAIQEWWSCPAPILMEPTVNATTAEVPSLDNGEDELPRTDRTVEEVSCTDWSGRRASH